MGNSLCRRLLFVAHRGAHTRSCESELKVRMRDVVIRGSKGSLHLVGTKTDIERKGTTLFFFRNDSICCPLTAMTATSQVGLRVEKIPPFLSTPIIRELPKNGS